MLSWILYALGAWLSDIEVHRTSHAYILHLLVSFVLAEAKHSHHV